MITADSKLEVSKGCLDFLVGEVEASRRRIEILQAENGVMNRFFGMIERLGPEKSQGYSEDQLYRAKKEIQSAVAVVESKN